MGFLLSLFFGFAPMLLFAGMIYWLDRYEKEPKKLIYGAFLWGAIIAAGGAFVLNTEIGVGIYAVTGSQTLAEISTGSIVAPIIEESLKALAVVLVFLFFFNEFDSILDGIVYAGVTALGFAATENVYYLYTYGFLADGYSGLFSMIFVRVILVGWQHPFYSAFFGIGLAAARLEKNIPLRAVYVALGLMTAMFTHAVHNTIPEVLPSAAGLIIGTVLDWSGWLLMLVFIVYMISREKRILQSQLAAEVEAGVMNQDQFTSAISELSRFRSGFTAFGTPRYRDVRLFYQLCAELAHKKHQFQRMGREQGNDILVAELRERVRTLSEILASGSAQIQPVDLE